MYTSTIPTQAQRIEQAARAHFINFIKQDIQEQYIPDVDIDELIAFCKEWGLWRALDCFDEYCSEFGIVIE